MTCHRALLHVGAAWTVMVALAAASVPQVARAQGPAQRSDVRVSNLEPWRDRPVVIVRGTAMGGALDVVTFDAATLRVTGRTPVGLACERLHAGGGSIACLRYELARSGISRLDVHDWQLQATQRHPLQAYSLISRARVSADGRYIGTTVFVSGHSYAVPGQFSTLTQVWDVRERRLALSLDTLKLSHEGRVVPYTPQTQLNYWGVTFDPGDADRFYVTVSIRGRPWLARGSISGGTAETLRPDVECPSISPDGKRIAFKKRRANGRHWDPAVLELASGRETVLPAEKGVDDQIEWLDNDTLLYEATETRMGGAKTDLMLRRLRADGPGEQLWLADAASPAVHRGAPAAFGGIRSPQR
jgi:hypothetical protein